MRMGPVIDEDGKQGGVPISVEKAARLPVIQ
jgi:hypothetical protein